jgi:hypothetical protein
MVHTSPLLPPFHSGCQHIRSLKCQRSHTWLDYMQNLHSKSLFRRDAGDRAAGFFYMFSISL